MAKTFSHTPRGSAPHTHHTHTTPWPNARKKMEIKGEMKRNCLILCLHFILASVVFAQGLVWSEPYVIESEHEGRYYSMFVDSEGRVWVGWYGGHVTVKCYEDSAWSETDTLWRDSEMLYGHPAFGESQDGKIWVFVEDNTMENSFMRAAYTDGISWVDSFVFDPPMGTDRLKPQTITDTLGRLVLFLPSYYLIWDFREWLGLYPYIAYYEIPIAAIFDTSGVLYVYSDIWGGFPASILKTRIELGGDTVFAAEAVLEHSHVDWWYSSFAVEPDGDIFLADGMDLYSAERRYIRALYKSGEIIDSVVLDSSSASGSTERQIRNTCPITQDSLGRYWFSWKIEKWGPNDSAYIAIYNTITHSIDTVFGIADSTIYGMITDNIGRIWMLIGANDTLMVKHTIDPVGIYQKEDSYNLPLSYIEAVFPNPANTSVCFSLNICEEGNYGLSIYNIKGEEVGILLNTRLQRRIFSFEYEFKNAVSGIYFAVLKGNNVILDTKKTIIIK